MKEKIYFVFAGVNGAGKTTLYRISAINSSVDKLGIRINTDEIVNEIGSWKSEKDQIRAARIAINLRKDCIKKEIHFNQETTLTGNSILKAIKDAKENGYKIKMSYVSVESPEIAKERVKRRVANGGHDIPADVIEKRYYESLENLKKIAKVCDELIIYDNSKTSHIRCLKKVEDKIFFSVEKSEIPTWVMNIAKELI